MSGRLIGDVLPGHPMPAAAFERLLERIVGTSRVWVATAGEVADHIGNLTFESVLHRPPRIDPSLLAPRVIPEEDS
jgi:hypothetical protein